METGSTFLSCHTANPSHNLPTCLIPWPAWCARVYYNLPAGAAWVARQRRRPSEHIVYGTEGMPQWMPAEELAAEEVSQTE